MQQAPWRYRVIRNDGSQVTFELIHREWGWVASTAVPLERWKSMTAGYTAVPDRKSP